ncbi:MAG: ABC transporter transmembrane domain-containing protein, partial [Armatimonadia bacterium]
MGFGRGMGGGGGRGRGGGGHMRGTSKTNPDEQEAPRLRLTDKRMLSWFGSKIGSRWPVVVIALVAMIISAFADQAQPMLIRRLIDQGFLKHSVPVINQVILLMLGAFAAGAVFSLIRTRLMHILGQRLVYETRVETYSHLQKLSLSYFHRNRTGDIMSRLSNDVGSVEDMVVHGTDEVISDGLRVAIAVGALFWMSWKLALLALLPVPFFLTLMIIFARYVRPLYRKIRDELGEINAQLEERVAGILVIKAFGRERYEYDNFESASRKYYDANVRAIRLWSTFFPVIAFLTSLGMLLVLWRGGLMMTKGEAVSIGTMMAFVGYLQQFYWRIGGLVRVVDLYNRALAALARIFQITDEVPEIQDKPEAKALDQVEGCVDLDHVT